MNASAALFFAALVFLSGCQEQATENLPVQEPEPGSETRRDANTDSLIFLNPEEAITLRDGNRLVYKGNVSVRTKDNAEWKAVFYANNNPEERLNAAENESIMAGGTEIAVKAFNTYKQGSVGVEIRDA